MTNHVYLMLQGKETPDQVAKTIQDGLDKWYKPIAAAK
jgi:hypothetical protein